MEQTAVVGEFEFLDEADGAQRLGVACRVADGCQLLSNRPENGARGLVTLMR